MQNLTTATGIRSGVFQQRPSQGWGTTADLENPDYATTKFFGALVQRARYTKLPVYRAAQDVQHSADGSAYEQYAEVAALLARYFTGGGRTACPAGTRHRGRRTWPVRCGRWRPRSGRRGAQGSWWGLPRTVRAK